MPAVVGRGLWCEDFSEFFVELELITRRIQNDTDDKLILSEIERSHLSVMIFFWDQFGMWCCGRERGGLLLTLEGLRKVFICI